MILTHMFIFFSRLSEKLEILILKILKKIFQLNFENVSQSVNKNGTIVNYDETHPRWKSILQFSKCVMRIAT